MEIFLCLILYWQSCSLKLLFFWNSSRDRSANQEAAQPGLVVRSAFSIHPDAGRRILLEGGARMSFFCKWKIPSGCTVPSTFSKKFLGRRTVMHLKINNKIFLILIFVFLNDERDSEVSFLTLKFFETLNETYINAAIVA